jgi:non-ribosomal peptide synthetase component E (peptide arylation enzyme)
VELYNLSADRIEHAQSAGWWPGHCLTDRLRVRVDADPHAIAVQTASRTLTRLELWSRSEAVAAGLARLGVGRGSIVPSQLPTSVDAVVLHHAIARLGAVTSPISPMHREQDLAHMLALTAPPVVVAPEEYRGVRYGEMHRAVAARLNLDIRVVSVGAAGLREACAGPAGELPEQPSDPNEPLYVVWTSGTSSGEPKGVVHTHNTGLCGLDRYLERIGASERDAMLVVTPVAHHIGIYAMHMLATHGIRIVLLESWSAEAALALIAEARPTFSSFTPTFLFDLLRAEGTPAADLRSLRMANCSGAPVPSALVDLAADVLPHCRILSAYGASEEGYIASVAPDDPPELSRGSVGRPLRDFEVRVVDADGRDLLRGEVGELWVRTPSSMAAYLRQEELTAAAFPQDGWRATGDRGRLRHDGTIEIVGRSKDQIIRGGLNVPVAQVEDALLRHPAITAAALVGMPDPRMGEKGCAFVVAAGGRPLQLAEVTAFLQEQGIAPPYLPERLECVAELPLTPARKVQKYRLRQIAAALAAAQPAS